MIVQLLVVIFSLFFSEYKHSLWTHLCSPWLLKRVKCRFIFLNPQNRSLSTNLDLKILLICSSNTAHSGLTAYCSFHLVSVWCIISKPFALSHFSPHSLSTAGLSERWTFQETLLTAVIGFFLQQETLWYMSTEKHVGRSSSVWLFWWKSVQTENNEPCHCSTDGYSSAWQSPRALVRFVHF